MQIFSDARKAGEICVALKCAEKDGTLMWAAVNELFIAR